MRLRLSTGIVLGLLLLRAYIPVGFMPSGAGLGLAICPDGLAVVAAHVHHPGMVMPAGGSRHGGHGAFDHCPFGSLPATGPVAASLGITPVVGITPFAVLPAPLPLPLTVVRDRAHLPRGPPSPA